MSSHGPVMLVRLLAVGHVAFAMRIRDRAASATASKLADESSGKQRCTPVLGLKGKLTKCEEICRAATEAVPQPLYPLYFFGGLGDKKGEREAAGLGNDFLSAIGACNGTGRTDCFDVAKVNKDLQYIDLGKVRGDVWGAFAFPLRTEAYFTCYQRGQWPIFESWLVDPKLQKSVKKHRDGTFKIPKDGDKLRLDYYDRDKIKDEYLRPSDVDGYWSEWFGLDRGHWAPDAAFRSEEEYVSKTYYYINVSPQSACLNRGNWERLEAGIRERASPKAMGGDNSAIAVTAGPLQVLPDTFVDTPAKREAFFQLLDFWAVAGEVLMEGVQGKDPHWVEVTWGAGTKEPGHCILRRRLAEDGRDARFGDLKDLDTCDVGKLTEQDLLPRLNLFLMTEAGKNRVRRGVRVPMAYYKVATVTRKNKWCCWVMDQLDNVAAATGEECLRSISKGAFGQSNVEALSILPHRRDYAGDQYCSGMFSPSLEKSNNCNFKDEGIGWRGRYLMKEAAGTIHDLERVIEDEGLPLPQGASVDSPTR